MIRLRELREARGLSVRDMCRRLGVEDSRYRKWESGTNGLPLEYSLACCDVLGCTLDELAGRDASSDGLMPASPEERRFVALYRACSPRGRETMLAMAETTAQLFGDE